MIKTNNYPTQIDDVTLKGLYIDENMSARQISIETNWDYGKIRRRIRKIPLSKGIRLANRDKYNQGAITQAFIYNEYIILKKSVARVSKEFGFSEKRLRDAIRQYGLENHPSKTSYKNNSKHKFSKVDIERTISEYGLIKNAASALGVSAEILRRLISKFNIKVPRYNRYILQDYATSTKKCQTTRLINKIRKLILKELLRQRDPIIRPPCPYPIKMKIRNAHIRNKPSRLKLPSTQLEVMSILDSLGVRYEFEANVRYIARVDILLLDYWRVVLEVDGIHHRKFDDIKRKDAFKMVAFGMMRYRVLRIRDDEISELKILELMVSAEDRKINRDLIPLTRG